MRRQQETQNLRLTVLLSRERFEEMHFALAMSLLLNDVFRNTDTLPRQGTLVKGCSDLVVDHESAQAWHSLIRLYLRFNTGRAFMVTEDA